MNPRYLLTRGRQLWRSESGDTALDKRNRHKWVRSILRTGDKWLLAKPVQRLGAKNC
jgi:hypothetical protein